MASPPKNKNRQPPACVALIAGTCAFCGLDLDDEERFGKKYTVKNLTVHYYCMLFASGLCQNDRDDGVLAGFLKQDVLKELKRSYRLRCTFCKKRGATIGCVVARCRMVFHLPCGQDNGILTQFTGQFVSYCSDHRPKQKVASKELEVFNGSPKPACAICMCSIESSSCLTTVKAPCCKNSWFHRQCVQRHASCSGLHFFKCPLCNNKDHFQQEMLIHGIYIPDQDAAWEQEPNAFQELLERHNRCDREKCKCPKGPDFRKDGTRWDIMLCDDCGSQGTHLACSNLKTAMDDWVCKPCKEITRNMNKETGHHMKNGAFGEDMKGKKSPGKRKDPVEKNWLEKKINAMKSPTVPSAKIRKRKRESSVSAVNFQSKKKKLSLGGASATCTQVAGSTRLNDAATSSDVQLDVDTPWFIKARSLGKKVAIRLTRMTPEMIRRANWLLAIREQMMSPVRHVTHTSCINKPPIPPEDPATPRNDGDHNILPITLEDFNEKHFSEGAMTRVSYCDRITSYEEYLDKFAADKTTNDIKIENSVMDDQKKNEETMDSASVVDDYRTCNDLEPSCEDSSSHQSMLSSFTKSSSPGTPLVKFKVDRVWSVASDVNTKGCPSPLSNTLSTDVDNEAINENLGLDETSQDTIFSTHSMESGITTLINQDIPKNKISHVNTQVITSDSEIPSSLVSEEPVLSEVDASTNVLPQDTSTLFQGDIPRVNDTGLHQEVKKSSFSIEVSQVSSTDQEQSEIKPSRSAPSVPEDVQSSIVDSSVQIDLTSSLDPEQDMLYIVPDPGNAGGDFIQFPDNNQTKQFFKDQQNLPYSSNQSRPCDGGTGSWRSHEENDPIVLSDDDVMVLSVTPGKVTYCCKCKKRKKRPKISSDSWHAYPNTNTLVPETVGPML